MKKIILALVLIITITAGAVFYLSQDKEGPPTLESANSKFLGKLSDVNQYFEFTNNYVKSYQPPRWIQDIKVTERKNYKKTIEAEPYINYLYYKEDKRIDTLFKDIIPTEDGGVYFMVYNPTTDYCVPGGQGFQTMQKDAVTLKAFCPLIIKSKNTTEIYGGFTPQQYVTPDEFDKIANRVDFKGWMLSPLPKETDFVNKIKSSGNNRITSITPLSKTGAFTGNDFDLTAQDDLEKVKVAKGKYLGWIKFGEVLPCPYGEYSSGTICKPCGAKKYRECTSEKPSHGEVAKWYFDESSGSKLLDIIGTNDGTITNASRVRGIVGNALKFNGKDSFVKIDHSPDFNFTDNITISVFAKPYDKTGGTIFSKNNIGIFKDERKGWKGTLTIDDKNFSIDWKKDLSPRMNEWTNIILTYDGEKIKLYVNGEEMSSLTKTGPIGISEEPIIIGAKGEVDYFNGEIDEIIMLNFALSRDDVKMLYDSYFEE